MQISKTICDYCGKSLREDSEELTDAHLRISFEDWPDYRWRTKSDDITFKMKRLDGDYCDIGCFVKRFKKIKARIEKERGK